MPTSRLLLLAVTTLLVMAVGPGCYRRGIVPDPNAPVPDYSFRDVIERFQKGEPGQAAAGEGQMPMMGFGPGMAPQTGQADTEADRAASPSATGSAQDGKPDADASASPSENPSPGDETGASPAKD